MVSQGHTGQLSAAIARIESERERQIPPLSQRAAAQKAGLSPEGWRKIVATGRARIESVLAMARAVDIEPEARRILELEPPTETREDPFPTGSSHADRERQLDAEAADIAARMYELAAELADVYARKDGSRGRADAG